MKTKFAACLICFFMIGILLSCLPGAASEAGFDPIAVNIDLDKTGFTEPGDVSVTIRISNVGDDRLPGPVYLFYPDGKAVTDFGDGGAAQLGLGEFASWTGSISVTQKQLELGRITFLVKYPIGDEEGNIDYKSSYFSKAIQYKTADTPSPAPVISPTPAPKPSQYVGYALTVRQEAIRIEAGNSGKSILAALPANTLVSVAGQVFAGTVPWSLVETLDGVTGYVPDDSLRRITPEEATFYIDRYNDAVSLQTPAPTPALPYAFDISDGKAIITKYTGTDSEIAVPKELNGCPVAYIGERAFEGCDTLTGITFPEGVTYIGEHALIGCAKLTCVNLPKSVTSIGEGAFYGCNRLARIEVDTQNAVYSVTGGVLFDNGKKMLHTYPAAKQNSRYSVPEGTAVIAKDAFYNCSSLQGIYLPESVTEIGAAAFSGCSSLTDISLPAGLAGIKSFTFRGCKKLEALIIPEKVTAIGDGAFDSCMSLNRVMIPGSVTQISKSAFMDSSGWPKAWLILYGDPGSYAQMYARENGFTFADAKVYSSLYGLDAFAKTSGSMPDSSADDPFAIFDSVPGAASNAYKTEEFDYFTDLVLDSLWPAAARAQAKENAELSPVQAYREQVLKGGGELSTTVSVQPGEGLGSGITSLLRSLQLRFHEKRQEDTAACALELVAGGNVPVYFSGLAGKDAVYLLGNLLEGDVLTVRREEIREGLLKSIQSFLSLLDTASAPQAWYLKDVLRSLMQKGSGFTETLSGGGGQTDAFLKRLMDRAEKTEDAVQSQLHDAASVSSCLHFTGDDVRDFLLLPQPDFLLRVLSQLMYYTPRNTSVVEILRQGDMMFFRFRNQLFQILNGGDITVRLSETGEVAAVEGSIDFNLAALPESDMKSASFIFTLYRKTEPEGPHYTLSGKLNIVFNEESAARYKADNCDVLYLDGEWQDNKEASVNATLRVRAQEPGRTGFILDTGLQYRSAVSGTKDGGTEEKRINFYIKNGEDMNTACLATSATVDGNGIGQSASLYLNDLQKPILTVCLDTKAALYSGLMDDVILPNSSRLIDPLYWSPETIQNYIAGHKDAIAQAVMALSYMLPPEVESFLEGF